MVRFAQNALDSGRPAARGVWVAGWALFLIQASGLAQAQTAPPAKTDGDIKTPYLDNYTPSEEVKRRALGPLRIIKQMGDQKKPAAPTPAPAPVVSPAPAAAPKPKVEEISAKADKKASVVETPASPPPVAVAPVAVTAPAPAAVVPPPEPVKVARQVNTELIPVVQDPPVLNRNAMRDIPGGGGLVKVAFDVKPDGTTGDIQVVSSNSRRLNTSAMDAVAKWRFKPIDETVRVDIELRFAPPE